MSMVSSQPRPARRDALGVAADSATGSSASRGERLSAAAGSMATPSSEKEKQRPTDCRAAPKHAERRRGSSAPAGTETAALENGRHTSRSLCEPAPASASSPTLARSGMPALMVLGLGAVFLNCMKRSQLSGRGEASDGAPGERLGRGVVWARLGQRRGASCSPASNSSCMRRLGKVTTPAVTSPEAGEGESPASSLVAMLEPWLWCRSGVA
mmetsp:Transcript_105166/g.307382  ORF Transcript_105166/g.307382 Transcript_105166/m.307382 type:complete len:212 (-) Transcript_105166:782-1417(-)